MYKENEYIMYKHDVCKIREIKHYNNQYYYVLIPLSDNSLTMSVPVENKQGNIREVLSKKDALKLIDNIKNIKPLDNLNDKLIENKYKELLNNCTHEDLITVIKSCFLRNKERLDSGKKIGEKDKSYFDRAEDYLYNELCISLNLSREEIEQLIYDKCSN